MNSPRLTPALLLIPLALTTLACPTRPLDRDAGSGGAGGEAGAATGGGGGQAGSSAGEGGVGGSSAGGSATAGAAGSVPGAGGNVAGAAGGVAGAAGGAAGAAGGTGGTTGAAAGAAGGAAGAAGGTSGKGGTTGTGGGLEDGQPCSLAANCASHVCTAFYVDVDGDGYGTGQAMGFCGTTAPIGYASQSGDCCDTATNLAVAKLIHPGAGSQITSAGGVCGITWDYDCSGTIEILVPTAASCGTYPDCVSNLVSFPDSDCGQQIVSMVCKPNGNSPTCDLAPGLTGPLACK